MAADHLTTKYGFQYNVLTDSNKDNAREIWGLLWHGKISNYKNTDYNLGKLLKNYWTVHMKNLGKSAANQEGINIRSKAEKSKSIKPERHGMEACLYLADPMGIYYYYSIMVKIFGSLQKFLFSLMVMASSLLLLLVAMGAYVPIYYEDPAFASLCPSGFRSNFSSYRESKKLYPQYSQLKMHTDKVSPPYKIITILLQS
ncbi:hypothetical protein BDA99DRAFT_567513 [Phascolomyces articulosus]|uniref:Uncharacterized protein n=1 Tax=Phascolomyces articulosus TaxID=60185 RepID=A0AAD5KCQ2_9FUNG|nr:hypothetical protein BDA99DRAFT_567513 [Phascolomyces articulosus]